ncbi:hypothetical protein ONS96_013943 [Cadophora gregata f. sp. sojae]|nr:hypothetical protein ONS96_013943 [Cadophora gregata f. sp. sojae]
MATHNDTTPEPTVFRARGMEIDTHLTVFSKVFHVSSAILKMHSQYFFKFLDSADKIAVESSDGFKYDWVTKIVDDGKDWQLVCAGPNAGDLNRPQWAKSKHERCYQTSAFRNILKAMYMLPYRLDRVQDLSNMTCLARFYMCLPLVSRTLDGALARSHSLSRVDLRDSCSELLSVAIELRHKALFEDSLIYCLGPFSNPVFQQMTDNKLNRLALSHYHKLRSDLSGLLHTIIHAMVEEGPLRGDHNTADDAFSSRPLACFRRAIDLEAQKFSGSGHVYLPRLLRGMLENERVFSSFITKGLASFMQNDLTIRHGLSEEAGKDSSEDYFLVSTIEGDDDYPWDTTVEDW